MNLYLAISFVFFPADHYLFLFNFTAEVAMPTLSDIERQMVGNAISNSLGHNNWAFWYDPEAHPPMIFWTDGSFDQGRPHSAVTLLLQWLLNRGREMEPSVRRGRVCISSSNNLTWMCRGMIEFVGVQALHVPPLQGGQVNNNPYGPQPRLGYGNINNFTRINRSSILSRDAFNAFAVGGLGENPNFPSMENETRNSGFHTVHRVYMLIAFALVAARCREGDVPGYNIGAVIVGPSGELLAWGVNTRYKNFTFHAEVNALQSYYHFSGGQQLPIGSRIYTTLKPCKMCAGMIRTCCLQEGHLKVFYGQEDTGAHACNTALDAIQGMQEQLGSGHAKGLSIYYSPVYSHYSSYKKQLRTTTSLGHFLEDRRKEENMYRAKFLKSSTAGNLLNKSLKSVVRKMDKYSRYPSNENVLKVMIHLLPFIRQHGLNKYFGGKINDVNLRKVTVEREDLNLQEGNRLQLQEDDLSQVWYILLNGNPTYSEDLNSKLEYYIEQSDEGEDDTMDEY